LLRGMALCCWQFHHRKKCLDSGALGEVSYCELHYDRFVPGIKDRWRSSTALTPEATTRF
jgi:hypothetical protein